MTEKTTIPTKTYEGMLAFINAVINEAYVSEKIENKKTVRIENLNEIIEKFRAV